MSFAQKDAAKKSRLTYFRMGMPKKLFQEIAAQQSSNKLRLLDSGRLKALGLEGIDPAYEEWLRQLKSATLAITLRMTFEFQRN
jgi:hypothetical protein